MTAPFAEACDTYIDAGWPGVFPVGTAPAQKSPPPTGYTGWDRRYPTPDDIEAWRSRQADRNIAGSVDEYTVGIDVDAYKNDGAALDVVARVEAVHGPLPATVMSTSRHDGSGIRFFRVSEPLGHAKTGLHDTDGSRADIELIHYGHRYPVVWPSVHDKTGETYRWVLTKDGSDLGRVPKPSGFPLLNAGWLAHLRGTCQCFGDPFAGAGNDGEGYAKYGSTREAYDEALAALKGGPGSRHDGVAGPVFRIAYFAAKGEPDAQGWLDDIHRKYVAAIAPDRAGGEREAEAEWDRMVEKPMREGRASGPWIEPIKINIESDEPLAAKAKPTDPDTQLTGDTRAAAHFVARVGDIVRWDNTNARWVIWSDSKHRWAQDATGQIKDIWRKVLEQRFAEAMKVGDESLRNSMIRAIVASGTTDSRYESGLKLARSRLPVRTSADDWDSDPWLMGVANGVVDLRTGTLLPDPKPAMVSKAARAAFDPTAKAPTFIRFLREVFAGPDVDEMVDWLQLLIGYTVVGMADEEIIVFPYGVGSNGKSTLLEALADVLGDYAGTLETEAVIGSRKGTGGTNEDTVALRGMRLAMAFEPPIGAHLNEKNLKRIASRDPLSGALKYGRRQEWLPTHTVWLATNSLPTVTDPTDATWRRIIALPFLNQWDKDGSRPDLPKADVGLPRRLKAERDGILAWIVEGAVRYNKVRTLLPMPHRVKMAREDYRGDEDTIARFVRDVVIDADEKTGKRALHQAYLLWCDGQGIKAQNRANERDFRAAFPARYFGVFGAEPTLKTVHGSEYWWPVALRQQGIRFHADPVGGHAGKNPEEADPRSEQADLGLGVVEGGGSAPTFSRSYSHGEVGDDPPPSTTQPVKQQPETVWIVKCKDYSAHQSKHRQVGAGQWTCDTCAVGDAHTIAAQDDDFGGGYDSFVSSSR